MVSAATVVAAAVVSAATVVAAAVVSAATVVVAGLSLLQAASIANDVRAATAQGYFFMWMGPPSEVIASQTITN